MRFPPETKDITREKSHHLTEVRSRPRTSMAGPAKPWRTLVGSAHSILKENIIARLVSADIRDLGSLHHVGVACRDLAATRAWIYETHDVVHDSGIVEDSAQEARLCMISTTSMRIELVSGPAVAGTIRRGQSLYHLCYEVEDVASTIAQLGEIGCIRVSGPTPAVLFDGRLVAFMVGPLGLFELLEAA